MSPANHVFHEIFLHINWHCHEDRALIAARHEGPLHALIDDYCRRCRGVHLKGLGGTATHMHLLVQVEPTVCPSDFIGKVKGFSAHEMNKRTRSAGLKWQRGYGVVSFAKRNLPGLLAYVQGQKEHHKAGSTRDTLERWSADLEEGEYRPQV